jgi:hypothetical protein
MASTSKVIAIDSASQAIPAVEPITQLELELFISLCNRLERLKEQVANEEATLRARLEAGADVQPGVHVASLKEGSRRNVAWKEVVMRLAEKLDYNPEAYCSNVLVHTKPTRTVSLVVN